MTDLNKPPSQDMQTGYALGMNAAKSLNEAVRSLAERVNELTILNMALMKKLNTNPDELMKLMEDVQLVGIAENKIVLA